MTKISFSFSEAVGMGGGEGRWGGELLGNSKISLPKDTDFNTATSTGTCM